MGIFADMAFSMSFQCLLQAVENILKIPEETLFVTTRFWGWKKWPNKGSSKSILESSKTAKNEKKILQWKAKTKYYLWAVFSKYLVVVKNMKYQTLKMPYLLEKSTFGWKNSPKKKNLLLLYMYQVFIFFQSFSIFSCIFKTTFAVQFLYIRHVFMIFNMTQNTISFSSTTEIWAFGTRLIPAV